MVVVDGVTAPINEPRPFCTRFSKIWFNEKTNGPGLNYKVATSILGGDIVWVNGPFPCGMQNDFTIFNEYGLREMLDEGERVESDDGYWGGVPEFVKTRSSPFVHDSAKDMRNKVRARHEAVNGRLKIWSILRTPYRHARTGERGLSSHQAVFFAICVITQIKINNKEINLFECESYNDSFKNYVDNLVGL